MAAAVADWRVESVAGHKLKKDGKSPPTLRLAENPDILATVAQRANDRPALVIGFAAETDDIVDNARAPNAPANAATGSSPPTMSPLVRGHSAVTATQFISSMREGSRTGRS